MGKKTASEVLKNFDKYLTYREDPNPASTPDAVRRLELVRADGIKMERTDWLLSERIPHREQTAMVGDPDIGKTMLCLDWAAQGTMGKLEGIYKGIPFDVIVASVEDSPSHTLVPRLTAAGADLTRVHFIKMKVGDDDGGGLSLPDDLPLLTEEIKRVDAKLLIIDPLMSHLGEGLNSNKDQDIRKAMSPLSTLGEECGVTTLVICHLNKNESASSKYRIGGSVGIFAVPRSVLLAGENPENEGEFVLVHLKCNVGQKAETLRYRLTQKLLKQKDGTFIETGVVVWGGAAESVTAESVLRGSDNDQEMTSTLEECQEWLQDRLTKGAMPTNSIIGEGKKLGFSEKTIRRAKTNLGIEAFKSEVKDGGWSWRNVPTQVTRVKKKGEDGQRGGEDGQCQKVDHLHLNTQEKRNNSNNLGEDGQGQDIDHLQRDVGHLQAGTKAERQVSLDL